MSSPKTVHLAPEVHELLKQIAEHEGATLSEALTACVLSVWRGIETTEPGALERAAVEITRRRDDRLIENKRLKDRGAMTPAERKRKERAKPAAFKFLPPSRSLTVDQRRALVSEAKRRSKLLDEKISAFPKDRRLTRMKGQTGRYVFAWSIRQGHLLKGQNPSLSRVAEDLIKSGHLPDGNAEKARQAARHLLKQVDTLEALGIWPTSAATV